MQSDCEMPRLDNVIDVLGLKLLFSLDPYFSTFKKKNLVVSFVSTVCHVHYDILYKQSKYYG